MAKPGGGLVVDLHYEGGFWTITINGTPLNLSDVRSFECVGVAGELPKLDMHTIWGAVDGTPREVQRVLNSKVAA